MAAAILSTPGTLFGPCAEPCQHSDCSSIRMIAETLCHFCEKPIGFDTRFYKDNDYVHATCLEAPLNKDHSTHV